mmetsp:Transcript_92057/g.256485  ORF Transcript_92057/g.256485 Transcript_92057/m.256485 type:complete len:151 (+) Transcript_92057:82-534(+)
MAVMPALVMARRLRSEEELRGVMLSSSADQIEAACKRAAAAGVPTALIEQALAAAARQARAGGDGWGAEGDLPAPAVAGRADAAWGIVRARRLRAEQELRAAAQAGGAERVAAARRRAEVAGVDPADIQAALAEEQGTAGLLMGSVAGVA